MPSGQTVSRFWWRSFFLLLLLLLLLLLIVSNVHILIIIQFSSRGIFLSSIVLIVFNKKRSIQNRLSWCMSGGSGRGLSINVTSHTCDIWAGTEKASSAAILFYCFRFKCAVYRKKINPFEAVYRKHKF